MRLGAIGIIATLALSLLGMPLAAQQQTKPMPRIGFLTGGSLASDAAWIEAFRQGLRELGYVEGHSIGCYTNPYPCKPHHGSTRGHPLP